MGRKGVSKRKPKKSKLSSNSDHSSGSSNGRSGERAPVQSLVTDKGAPLNRGGMNPSAGSHKTQKKR